MMQLPAQPVILEVGCGTGMSSIELAKSSKGTVFCLDNNQVYLDTLIENAKEEGVDEQIQIINQRIETMQFTKDTFDVIWSENSVFLLGLRNALHDWKHFVKQDGYVVISTIAKLRDDPPADARSHWEGTYPSMMTQEDITDLILSQGYSLIGTYKIPDSESWENCYEPLEKRIEEMKREWAHKKQYLAELNLNQREIDIFRKYGSEFYGSLFFIMQNTD